MDKTRQAIQAILSGQSPQKNYQHACELALDQVRKENPSQFERLGAKVLSAGQLSLPVLGDDFQIDLNVGTVKDHTGQDVSVAWKILALHYLLTHPTQLSNAAFISFMDIPEARGYATPYQGRVLGRFLHTAGRDQITLDSAATRLAAKTLELAQVAYEFAVFPLIQMRIIWYPGDEEVPPGASFLYQQNIEQVLCVEDIVVMSELLVKALSDK